MFLFVNHHHAYPFFIDRYLPTFTPHRPPTQAHPNAHMGNMNAQTHRNIYIVTIINVWLSDKECVR